MNGSLWAGACFSDEAEILNALPNGTPPILYSPSSPASTEIAPIVAMLWTPSANISFIISAGNRESFAFETTLAGRGYARLIPQWRDAGYWVHLTFLKLHDPDLAIERVATRVAQGGHDVSEPVVRRRFAEGWSNFQNVYRDLVDSWRLYDNSVEQPVLLEESSHHE